ncbi:hypothetical protein DFS34DRAFT_598583 [Phlyctochytrium arcticum]|nr:hypothetical protein DFS34DRAFT_598583 [Phlyctochytrium arcticum]
MWTGLLRYSSIAQKCIVEFSGDCDSSLNDAFIVALAQNCKVLGRLCIPKCRAVTNIAILAVAENCPQLSELDVTDSNVDDTTVRKLVDKCPDLFSLKLYGCTGIWEATVLYIFEHAKNLQFLDVGDCNLSHWYIKLHKPEHLDVNLDLDYW